MIERKYKTFWLRFWAGLIDSLILYPLILLNEAVWGYHDALPIFVMLLWFAMYSFAFSAYDILMHGNYGQTLGKMAMKVKVRNITESPLSMLQAFRREIIPLGFTIANLIIEVPRIVSGVNIMDPRLFQFYTAFYLTMVSSLGWFMAEMITMLFSGKRRALHDLIAGSVVTRLPQPRAALDRHETAHASK